MKRGKKILSMALAALLLAAAPGASALAAPVSAAPAGQVSYLTGQPVAAGQQSQRPIAVMLNNIKSGCPQSGIAEASVVYEAPVEGRITRLMGLYENWPAIENIGYVRSSRDYFVYCALEHDAIYCHYGQATPYVGDLLNSPRVDNVSGAVAGINVPVSYTHLDVYKRQVPDEYAARVRYIREHTQGIENVVLSCHVHNDLGMAVAISLAGVQAGIDQIECTINGIGERAGNASMEECVMALNTRKDAFGIECNIDTRQIYRASRMIQTITGVSIAPTKPIVGANAFAHESGIHQHGVLANKQTYEIMTPESVGIPKNAIVLGKHSGRHAFEDRLRELGYSLDKEGLDKAFEKFKVLADKKKVIKDRDLEALVGAVPVSGAERYTLDRFVINSGNSITSTAVIRVKKGDEVFERVAASDGPINAAFRAINKIEMCIRDRYNSDDNGNIE